MKPKLYLDTSIPSAYYDNSKPIRQLITQKWFENDAKKYNLFISTITMLELEKTFNTDKRNNLIELIENHNCEILKENEKTIKLSKIYIQKGAISQKEIEDASHVAVATIHSILFLASWNFSHLVSFNPIRKIHEINKN